MFWPLCKFNRALSAISSFMKSSFSALFLNWVGISKDINIKFIIT